MCRCRRRRSVSGRPSRKPSTDEAAMKQRIFGWISVLIGIVLALALIEVTAIAWLYIEDGRYTPAAELFERTQNTYVRDATKGTACRYVDTLYPHPYVAFVHHANPPCGMPWVNNVGLFGPDFPTVKPSRLLRRDADRRLGRLAARPEPGAAGAALPRGGAEQEIRQPQRQAVAGAERRRRRLEGAAAFHPVLPLCQLGRRDDLAGRLQRALLLPALFERAAGKPRLQLPGGQSFRGR